MKYSRDFSALFLRCTVNLAMLALLLALPLSADSSPTFRTVALTGWHAPGSSSEAAFGGNFGTPVLNDVGQIAFHAAVTNSTLGRGVWSEGTGTLALAIGRGTQVPGAEAGVQFFDFGAVVLNDGGQIAFDASLSGPGVHSANNSGVFVERSGGYAMVAREGSQAFGLPNGVTHRSEFLFDALLNNVGRTAVSSVVEGSGIDGTNNSAIWSEVSGSNAVLARSGDPVPNMPSGVMFATPIVNRPFDRPVLNDAGQVAFVARLVGGDVDAANNGGIWSGAPGDLRLVASKGMDAPGTPAGVTFSDISRPALNILGQTAFIARLNGIGIDSSNDHGIWSEQSGGLSLVARNGEQAVGTPQGVNYRLETSLPVLNNAGKTAFIAGLSGNGVDGTNNRGVWSEGFGSLALVARSGEQAPGTANGVNFVNFSTDSIILNDAGQTALTGTLTGASVNDTNDFGIWATDRSGALQLIAREGDLLEVGQGDLRTIDALDFVGGTGNADGRPSGFNNRGQLTFLARFTDGTQGVFVSGLVAIPEPSSGLLVIIAMMGLGVSRRGVRTHR